RSCRAGLQRRCGRNADGELRRLAVHVRRARAVLRRGRVSLWRAGQCRGQSVRVLALREGLPDAPGARHVLQSAARRRRPTDTVPRRAALTPYVPDLRELAFPRQPPAVRRLRTVQRQRLSEQLEGLTTRHRPVEGAAYQSLPGACQLPRETVGERRRPR